MLDKVDKYYEAVEIRKRKAYADAKAGDREMFDRAVAFASMLDLMKLNEYEVRATIEHFCIGLINDMRCKYMGA